MEKITIQTTVNVSPQTVWDAWTKPEHIMQWNHASDDWHCPVATNDLRVGGKFSARMEAKDGSVGFDFEGVYTEIKPLSIIEYEMSDGRKVVVRFEQTAEGTRVVETFDPESQNPIEMQKAGWQAILDNFKKHCESLE